MDSSPPYTASSRRRLTRTIPGQDESVSTTSSVQAGPSRLPDLTQLVDVNFSEIGDTESDDHSTPRLPTTSKLPPPNGETPAARLRALLSLVPNHSTPTPVPPPSPPAVPESTSDYESDFDKGESINATTASIARESLRDVFSRALRAPGGTPQKQKKRRSSIDASDIDASPRVERERSKNRSNRKSLSDEEVENSYRSAMQPQSSFKTRGHPLTMEVLQQRYMNSKSNRDDAQASSDRRDFGSIVAGRSTKPVVDDASEDTAYLLKELNSSRTSPPIATSTPQHSFGISVGSHDQLQSNLLDQDPEMQRIIEGMDSYDQAQQIADTLSNVSGRISFPGHSESTVHQPATPRADSLPRSPSRLPVSSSRKSVSLLSPKAVESQSSRDRLWSFPKPPRTFTPKVKAENEVNSTGKSPLTSKSLAAHSRTMSPRLSEGSSRSGSVISNTDRRDRTQSFEQDSLHHRERQWNKTTSSLSRRTSTTSLNSPQPAERPRTQSASSSTDSFGSDSNSPSTSRNLRRHSSQMSARSISPTGSAHASQEEAVIPKVVLERERNWNSPRPVWTEASPRRADSPTMLNPSPQPYSHSRARTMSLSSMDGLSDDSHNPDSMPSPSSGSRIRHHSSAGMSRPLRSRASSPSVQANSRVAPPFPPVSPSVRRQGSALNLQSPGDDQKIAKSTRTSSFTNRSKSSIHSTSKLFPPHSGKSTEISTDRFTRTTSTAKPLDSSEAAAHTSKSLAEAYENISDRDGSSSGNDQPTTTEGPSQLDAPDDSEPQELTPTLRTVAPPPTDSPERAHPPSNQTDISEPSYQEGGNSGSELPPSPLAEAPMMEMPSFVTPPRQPSSSSLRLQFLSPSTLPQNLPPLPEPPSTDDESNDDSGWNHPRPARLFPTDGNSVAKTPRAPVDTPAPKRRPRAYSDTSLHRDSDSLEPPTPSAPNLSTMQTPKPPGGWHATPAPARARYVDQSVETDSEPDIEPDVEVDPRARGLSTPTTSLSKAAQYSQTPAAPGAWIQTPAGRKSVMKVRFDSDANETREFRTGESDASASDIMNASTNSQETQTVSPPATPGLVGTTLSSSPRKTPTIRVLDAYGNEQPKERSQSHRKSASHGSIRMVDATGQSIGGDNLQEGDSSNSMGSIPPGTRDELLSRVRRGLDELVQEMHEMDRTTAMSPLELSRVKELDSVSLHSREKRRRLSGDLKKNNDTFKNKFSSLRAGMLKSSLTNASNNSGGSRFSISPIRLVVLVVVQAIVLTFMYRLSTSRARELFLTTYYDPLVPDLHASLFKSRLLLSTSPERYVSWLTLHDLFREQGFKACASQARDNLSIILSNLQSSAWERWGIDETTQKIAWPPT